MIDYKLQDDSILAENKFYRQLKFANYIYKNSSDSKEQMPSSVKITINEEQIRCLWEQLDNYPSQIDCCRISDQLYLFSRVEREKLMDYIGVGNKILDLLFLLSKLSSQRSILKCFCELSPLIFCNDHFNRTKELLLHSQLFEILDHIISYTLDNETINYLLYFVAFSMYDLEFRKKLCEHSFFWKIFDIKSEDLEIPKLYVIRQASLGGYSEDSEDIAHILMKYLFNATYSSYELAIYGYSGLRHLLMWSGAPFYELQNKVFIHRMGEWLNEVNYDYVHRKIIKLLTDCVKYDDFPAEPLFQYNFIEFPINLITIGTIKTQHLILELIKVFLQRSDESYYVEFLSLICQVNFNSAFSDVPYGLKEQLLSVFPLIVYFSDIDQLHIFFNEDTISLLSDFLFSNVHSVVYDCTRIFLTIIVEKTNYDQELIDLIRVTLEENEALNALHDYYNNPPHIHLDTERFGNEMIKIGELLSILGVNIGE